MSCLSAARRAQLNEDLIKVISQIKDANTAFDLAVQNSEVSRYNFNSTEGQQSTERRDPKQILKMIDMLEAKRDRIQKKLRLGGGIVNMNTRRKPHGGM